MTRLISYIKRIPDKVPDFTDEQVKEWEKSNDRFCYFVLSVLVFYLAAWLLSYWWPNLRNMLVAVNGM